MLKDIIKKRIFEQFYENNRGFYEKVALEAAKKRGIPIRSGHLLLWHATSKKNHKSILKQEKLKSGTFFADTSEGSEFWGERNIGKDYVLMQCLVHPSGVLPHGEYWVANGDLYLKDHNFWTPKEVSESKSVLSEERIPMGELSSSMKVVLDDRGNSKEYRLYNVENDFLAGNIEINKTSSGDYEVRGVAAQRGLGATMYEIAMMDVFPKGLMPDRDGNTTDEAYRVWKKFFLRNDVSKKENPDWQNMFDDSDKNFLVNVIYFLAPSDDFKFLPFMDADEDLTHKLRKKNSSFFNKMRKDRGYE